MSDPAYAFPCGYPGVRFCPNIVPKPVTTRDSSVVGKIFFPRRSQQRPIRDHQRPSALSAEPSSALRLPDRLSNFAACVLRRYTLPAWRGSSSLNRPHPPHSQAHRDFTARRLIRDAFAGAPRRPASGSGLSLTVPSWHAALYDLGEFDHRYGPVLRCRHGLRRDLSSSALPKFPQSASRGGCTGPG